MFFLRVWQLDVTNMVTGLIALQMPGALVPATETKS